jgi:hypothetical protein
MLVKVHLSTHACNHLLELSPVGSPAIAQGSPRRATSEASSPATVLELQSALAAVRRLASLCRRVRSKQPIAWRGYGAKGYKQNVLLHMAAAKTRAVQAPFTGHRSDERHSTK